MFGGRMSDRHPNVRLIREFHDGQNRFYAGGDQRSVAAMLTEDVTWHVPGRNALAGDYRGRDEVLRYFAMRRDLAAATFRIDLRGVLADDDGSVVLAGGEVKRGLETFTWGTEVRFRIADRKIAECWVLPLDQSVFDEIWSSDHGVALPADAMTTHLARPAILGLGGIVAAFGSRARA